MSIIEHMNNKGAAHLALDNEHELCEGFSRAEQRLAIGSEPVAIDEVLVEEVRHQSAERMHAELDSLTIKSGMFSPFADSSTPPPKYCYVDDDTATAWLVTSVPRSSAGRLFAVLRDRFPSRYTWDKSAFAAELAKKTIAAFSAAWANNRNPLHLFASVRLAMVSMFNLRVAQTERFRFAAQLVDVVRRRHRRGIYQNNIIPETVFYSDACSPRLLGNYSGRQPAVMNACLPPELLEKTRDAGYGPAFVDVYCLALLAYEIITGERIDGREFRLDVASTVPPEPGHLSFKHFTGRFAELNSALDLADDLYRGIIRAWRTLRATLDETKWPRFRRLVRASGGMVRALPGIRLVADIVFPTRTARTLRAILDRRFHHSPAVGMPVITIGHRRIDAAFLRAAFPARNLTKKSRFAVTLQDMIDAIDERQIERIDEGKSMARILAAPGVRRSMRHAAWGLIGIIMLLVTDVDVDLNRETSRMAANPAINRRAQPVQQRLLGILASQPLAGERGRQGADNRSIAVEPGRDRREIEPCRPYLAAEGDYVGVFRVLDLKEGCEAGDLIFNDDRGQTRTLRDASDGFSRYFVVRRTSEGWGRIITIRMCTRDHAALVKGLFYETAGFSEMGEKIVLSNGDMFAFSASSLNQFKNDHP